MPAKVHQITHRHHIEVGLNLYTRRLDKIYENLGKSPMLPKVVKKMREEYANNPHKFYTMVCQKYNITPEEEIDAYRLVYGRTQFEKHDYEFHKRESEEKETKEVVHEVKEEPSTSEEEDDEEEEEEEEEEDEPEPPKKERKYKFEMPERPSRRASPRYEQRTSPRYEQRSSPRYEQRSSPRYESTSYRSSSPRNENRSSPRRSSPRYAPSLNVNVGSSPRKEVLESPRVGSPRALYRYNKGQSVEQLDYVNVHPGDIVETMVLTGKTGNQESGFWIPARILVIDEKKELMDLQVLQPIKYGLAQKAVGVPYRYVRKPANIVWKR